MKRVLMALGAAAAFVVVALVGSGAANASGAPDVTKWHTSVVEVGDILVKKNDILVDVDVLNGGCRSKVPC